MVIFKTGTFRDESQPIVGFGNRVADDVQVLSHLDSIIVEAKRRQGRRSRRRGGAPIVSLLNGHKSGTERLAAVFT